MSSSMKQTNSILLVLLLSVVGCRVPYSDSNGTDIETDDTDTGTPDLPDAGPGGQCPDDTGDNFDNTAAPFLGGEVEIRVEVSIATDFHCPWCLTFAMEFLDIIDRQDWKDYVRVYYHHYPLYMHPESWDVHYAAVAVQNQSLDQFWTLHDEVFLSENDKDRMTIEEVVDFVDSELDLDMALFEKDRISQATIDFVQYERKQADAQGLTGTPSVWVCGTKISWGDLEEVVDAYLDGGSSDADADTDTDTDTDTDSDTDISDGGV